MLDKTMIRWNLDHIQELCAETDKAIFVGSHCQNILNLIKDHEATFRCDHCTYKRRGQEYCDHNRMEIKPSFFCADWEEDMG